VIVAEDPLASVARGSGTLLQMIDRKSSAVLAIE
jgi:actin-like ATPase involved in cell morphogenesis